uniref:(northern house mosquito) hypothetical protein n=1 Tax=Culex pipiens TaxID=7175 RepID=A0A8D8BFE6_CULPI
MVQIGGTFRSTTVRDVVEIIRRGQQMMPPANDSPQSNYVDQHTQQQRRKHRTQGGYLFIAVQGKQDGRKPQETATEGDVRHIPRVHLLETGLVRDQVVEISRGEDYVRRPDQRVHNQGVKSFLELCQRSFQQQCSEQQSHVHHDELPEDAVEVSLESVQQDG